MNELSDQLVILLRSQDADFWVQLLIFIIVMAFYALGAIIRAKAAKLEPDDREKPSSDYPPRKPPAADAKRIKRQPYKVSTRQDRDLPPRKVKTYKLPVKAPQPDISIAAGLSEDSGSRTKIDLRESDTVAKSLIERSAVKPEPEILISPPPYLSDLITGQAGIDELRKAILYHEIFGKPISIRSPADNIIGLSGFSQVHFF